MKNRIENLEHSETKTAEMIENKIIENEKKSERRYSLTSWRCQKKWKKPLMEGWRVKQESQDFWKQGRVTI